MLRHLGWVQHERTARQRDADLQPARRGNEFRNGMLRARSVKQPRDIRPKRLPPAQSTANHATAAEAEKTVASRKSSFIDGFADWIVPLCAQHPGRIRRRFEKVFHHYPIDYIDSVGRHDLRADQASDGHRRTITEPHRSNGLPCAVRAEIYLCFGAGWVTGLLCDKVETKGHRDRKSTRLNSSHLGI